MSLARALEHVFGCPAGALVDPDDIQKRALSYNRASWNGDDSTCSEYLGYLEHEEIFLKACQRSTWLGIAHTDVFHWMWDVVLAAIPYRHEVFRDENGWKLRTSALFQEAPWPDTDEATRKRRRGAWLVPLLPTYDDFQRELPPWRRDPEQLARMRTQQAAQSWERDGRPDFQGILETFAGSRRTCGDALGALWGCFFLEAGAALSVLCDELTEHPSAAVRSAVQLALQAQRGQGGRFGEVAREQRELFLDALTSP
jgi:hypothetical protein